jgi:nicotinamide mononucleotide transporter
MTDPLEIAATVLTLICVILAVKRSLWQFPTGILGTALGFFVFWGAGLYSSAFLQPFFIVVQVYGWWYWTRGDKGHKPRIRSTDPWLVATACLAALCVAVGAAYALEQLTDAQMAVPDAAIFGLSVVAQILLDRKRVENWPVWVIVNVLSVYVYASQGLWLYTGLYAFFIFNAVWGWWEWRKELLSYGAEVASTKDESAA